MLRFISFYQSFLEGRGYFLGYSERHVVAIHPAALNLTAAIGQGWNETVLRILEASEISLKAQVHIACSALTMLGNNDLSDATQVVSLVVLEDAIVFGTMHEQHHIGILLDSSRLTEIAELRALALVALAILYATVELREC